MDNLNGVMHTFRSPYENFDGNPAQYFGIDIATDNQNHRPFPDDYFPNYQAPSYLAADNHHQSGNSQFESQAVSSQIVKCNECGMLFDSPFALKDHAERYHRFNQQGNPNETAEILDLDSHKVHVYQPPAPAAPAENTASPNSPKPPAEWSGFNGHAFSEPPKTENQQEPEQPKRERNTSGKGSERTSEGGRPKTYSCEPCGKWFTSNGHLKRHYNTTLHKNATKSLNKPEEPSEPQEVEIKAEEVQAPFNVPEEAPQNIINNQMDINNQRWLIPQSNEHIQAPIEYNYQNLNYQPHVIPEAVSHYNAMPPQQYYQQNQDYPTQVYTDNQEKKIDMFNNGPIQSSVYYQPLKPEPVQSYEMQSQPYYSNGSSPAVFNNNNIIRQELEDSQHDGKIDFVKDSSNDDNSMKDSEEEASESKAVNKQVNKKKEDTGAATGSFKCTQCDKAFNRICYLTQHNNTFHKGDKPFKCHLCGKRFQSADLFEQHQQKHAGDKPYKCSLCPKQFNHKTDLRRHMCLHTGQKPFMCQICNKGFIRKDHMVKHAQTHTKRSALHQQQQQQSAAL